MIKIDTKIGQVITAQGNMMMINIEKDQTGDGQQTILDNQLIKAIQKIGIIVKIEEIV